MAGLFMQEEGQGPPLETVKSLFHAFDKNKDGKIQQDELRGLIIGIGLEEVGWGNFLLSPFASIMKLYQQSKFCNL